MLARGVGVAAPESVPRGRFDVCWKGVGSMTFVRLGRGEDGREGGSWTGAGVVMSSVDIVGCDVCADVELMAGEGGEDEVGWETRWSGVTRKTRWSALLLVGLARWYPFHVRLHDSTGTPCELN